MKIGEQIYLNGKQLEIIWIYENGYIEVRNSTDKKVLLLTEMEYMQTIERTATE